MEMEKPDTIVSGFSGLICYWEETVD